MTIINNTNILKEDRMTHDITVDIEAEARTVADTILPLLRGSDDLKWQIGDVLVNWINPTGGLSEVGHYLHNNNAAAFAAVASLLDASGHEVSEKTLRDYYRTASAFPAGQRSADVAFTTHLAVAGSGAPEGSPERMRVMLASFAASGTAPSTRNALRFFGRTPTGGGGEKGAEEYIARHPEIVTRAVQENPQVAEAARAGLAAPQPTVEDDSPLPPRIRPAAPVPNQSLTRITFMERDLRSLRSSVPYLHSEAERDEVLVRIQGLIDGLQECVERVDIRWQAA